MSPVLPPEESELLPAVHRLQQVAVRLWAQHMIQLRQQLYYDILVAAKPVQWIGDHSEQYMTWRLVGGVNRCTKTNLQVIKPAILDPSAMPPYTALACRRAPAVRLLLNSSSLYIIRLQPRCLTVRPAGAVMPSFTVLNLHMITYLVRLLDKL